ncbi:hypothetical protein [Puia dinghuensis]|uniref:RES domain-containing protein n=1 Tax=Puia dinghuensis TaxID=1792502 RepID=A0A8J2UDB1_9BACT|nr:hypothetical protein [Puia dinghuensis]GGB00624.1 hypothetical protein GCM10011511_24900 [Puia dinghuensis]
MSYLQPFQITGFHSCDRDLGLRLLNGSDELRPSNNPWDWLGEGIYFWEQNPYRALSYAEEAARKQQKFAGKIRIPFVVGAIIELGNCLNLIEPNSIDVVKQAHTELLLTLQDGGKQLPINNGPNRQLDCAVINFMHESNGKKGFPAYDTVRSPFPEGGPIYAGANFTDRLHIEICVINPKCIKGYFLPRPVEMFNPYLSKEYRA